jgi:hypothetical protein
MTFVTALAAPDSYTGAAIEDRPVGTGQPEIYHQHSMGDL